MPSLLRKVKSRLFISSRRHAFHQLDGQYRSQARGRGNDFDDLREYAPGDDVRDIDWNATARGTTTLVRRYRTERKQLVTFLVNTGRSMTAVTRTHEPKAAVSLFVVGAMAYLSAKHGDDVGMLYGPAGTPKRVGPGRTDAHLERILRAIETAARPDGGLDGLGPLLDFAARTIKRRTILVCVTDEAPLDEASVQTLRRLKVRHDVLWLRIGDSELERPRRRSAQPTFDVTSGRVIPRFVLSGHGVREEASSSRAAHRVAEGELLDRMGISHATIHSEAEAVSELVSLLSRRGYARG